MGTHPPMTRDTSAEHVLRVSSHEHEIQSLMERFPKLTRTEVADVIGRTGPMRGVVEAELEKISAAKR
jgi:hypothetical protein